MEIDSIMNKLKSVEKLYTSQQVGSNLFHYDIRATETDEVIHDIIDIISYLLDENIRLNRRINQLEPDKNYQLNQRINQFDNNFQ